MCECDSLRRTLDDADPMSEFVCKCKRRFLITNESTNKKNIKFIFNATFLSLDGALGRILGDKQPFFSPSSSSPLLWIQSYFQAARTRLLCGSVSAVAKPASLHPVHHTTRESGEQPAGGPRHHVQGRRRERISVNARASRAPFI